MVGSSTWKRRPLTRISATADNIHQAQFALDVKEKVLPLYEQVFDIEYPLPKLDTLVVSVPFLFSTPDAIFTLFPLATDFDSGAM